ncbi:MAG: DUF2231 domain-containing protein [Gemmatimonadales bacterium]
MLHGLGNVVVVILFAISWWLRQADPGSPSVVALCFMLVGAALSLVTGWLGGELVDRLGVGVDDGAHLDAPSSLSSKPARPGSHRDSCRTGPKRRNRRGRLGLGHRDGD